MPHDAGSINTGDAIAGNFDYVAVNGTPPYTYEITFAGLAGSGIVANIGGAESNEITFDTTLAVAGTYVIEIKGKVTDDVGDVNQNDADDVDTLTVTILPITASWDVGPTWVPADVEQAASTATSATLTVGGGGAAPYNYHFEIVGGDPAGISLVQADPTDNIIEIAVAGTVAPGVYNLVIRGQVSDATGQFEGPFDLNVTLTVLGMRNWTWTPNPLSEESLSVGESSGNAVIAPGVGGVAPYSYNVFWLDQTNPNHSLKYAAGSTTVAIVINAGSPTAQFFAGSIRGRVTDSVGNQIEVDLPVDFFVNTLVLTDAGTNTFLATLLGLGVSHVWELGETSGNVADTGLASELITMGTSMVPWQAAPGVIPGVPRTYGLWSSPRDFSSIGPPRWVSSGVSPELDPAGWIVGAFGFAGIVWDLTESEQYVIYVFYGTSSKHMRFTIFLDGSVEFQVLDVSRITAATVAGTIVEGEPFVMTATQRADGTGIHLHHNGLDVTDNNSLAGSATLDSWAADILAGETPTSITIPGENNITTSNAHFSITTMPFIFKDSALSDENIEALHLAANFAGISRPTDIFETVRKVCEDTQRIWIQPFVPGGGSISIELMSNAGINPPGASFGLSGNSPPYTISLNTTIPSDYQMYRLNGSGTTGATANQIQSGDVDGGSDWPVDGTEDVGSFWFAVQMDFGVASGERKPLWSMENSTGKLFEFYVTNVAATYNLVISLFDGVDTYTRTAALSFGVSADLHVFGAVQDGADIQLYVDGDPISSIATGALASTFWYDVLAPYAPGGGGQFRLIADANNLFTAEGIWGANDFHAMVSCDKVLSGAEMLEVWNGYNGIFP